MTRLAALLLAGYLAYYAPGLMQRVAEYRGLPSAGCLAAADAPLGTRLRVAGPHGALDCVVVDVPHPRDLPSIARRGIVVELDRESARAVCGPLGRPEECRVTVTRISDREDGHNGRR